MGGVGMIANVRSRIAMVLPTASSRFPKSTCSTASGNASATSRRSARPVTAGSACRWSNVSSSCSVGPAEPTRSTWGMGLALLADDDVDQPAAAGVDDLERLPTAQRRADVVA